MWRDIVAVTRSRLQQSGVAMRMLGACHKASPSPPLPHTSALLLQYTTSQRITYMPIQTYSTTSRLLNNTNASVKDSDSDAYPSLPSPPPLPDVEIYTRGSNKKKQWWVQQHGESATYSTPSESNKSLSRPLPSPSSSFPITTVIYADGTVSEAKEGGYGVVIKRGEDEVRWGGRDASGEEVDIDAMELRAVVEGLKRVASGEGVLVYGDSQFAILGAQSPKRRGDGSRYQPLWKALDEELDRLGGNVSFQWVKSHSGNYYHDLSDKLAVGAVRRPSPSPPSSPATTSTATRAATDASLRCASILPGSIVQMCRHRVGSESVQALIAEGKRVDDLAAIVREVTEGGNIVKVANHIFGSRVMESLLADSRYRDDVASKVVGSPLDMAMDKHGSFVVTKALEVGGDDAVHALLVGLDSNVLRCCHDKYGSHVMRRVLSSSSQEGRRLLVDRILDQPRDGLKAMAMHEYASPIMERILEGGTSEEKGGLVASLEGSFMALATDVYGSHVIQKVLLINPGPVIREMRGHVLTCSMHRYGNFVLTKALQVSEEGSCTALMTELRGNLLSCATNQYGSFVLTKALALLSERVNQGIVEELQGHWLQCATNEYGFEVVRAIVSATGGETHMSLVSQLKGDIVACSSDKFGCRITEHMLEVGGEDVRRAVAGEFVGSVKASASNKYACHILMRVCALAPPALKTKLYQELLAGVKVLSRDLYGRRVLAHIIERERNTVPDPASSKVSRAVVLRLEEEVRQLQEARRQTHVNQMYSTM